MNKRLIGGASAVAIAVVLYACGGSGSSNPSVDVSKGTVLLNANVVNTRDGSVSTGMSIVIDGGKIQQIVPGGTNVTVSGSGQAVDASGKFVVPGYQDMHVHSMDAADLQPTDWPLYIANGVTGVRQMGGSAALIQRARKLNADSAAGLVDAPEVLMIPGTLFAGQTATAAAAVKFVQDRKAEGADFIKVAAGNRESVLAILNEAKNQNLGVAGHLVPAVSALESSNAGWRAIEHLGAGWGLILDCANDEAAIRSAVLSGQAFNPPFPATFTLNPRVYDGTINGKFYQRIFDTYSDAKCQSLAQAFVRNETWQVPTLIRLRTQNFGSDALYRNDPNLIYVSRATRALWEQLAVEYVANLSASTSATLKQYYGLEQKVTKMLKQSGVKMMAGSDTSTSAVWVIPGFSLHQEFRELAASGLSPLEILQMTTLNPAEFLSRQSTMGTVDVGKNADLVVLDANPMLDVANLSKIAAVVMKGKYFSKAALDKQKSDVADAYSKVTIQTIASLIETMHKD